MVSFSDVDKFSDDDLLKLLEIVITAVNLRFFLSGLTDDCEININLTKKREEGRYE